MEALLKGGNFASDEVIFKLVNKFIKENEGKSIIFDGFPRNLEQAKKCTKLGIHFNQIFYLDVPNELLEERVLNRRIHLASGRSYNLKTIPPKVDGLDDITGEPLTHRNDDTKEALMKRIEIYHRETEPILNLLESKGEKINRMDGKKDYKILSNLILLKIKLELFNNEAQKLEKIKKELIKINNSIIKYKNDSKPSEKTPSSEEISKLQKTNASLNQKIKKKF